MAKRTQGSDGQSLILRSAESLGRMIGALQRQLDALATRERTRPKKSVKKKLPAATRKASVRKTGARKKPTGRAAKTGG
jgi:hypothetical protein